jgi:hypothetical protein
VNEAVNSSGISRSRVTVWRRPHYHAVRVGTKLAAGVAAATQIRIVTQIVTRTAKNEKGLAGTYRLTLTNLGRTYWGRTSDKRIKSPLLYQLS